MSSCLPFRVRYADNYLPGSGSAGSSAGDSERQRGFRVRRPIPFTVKYSVLELSVGKLVPKYPVNINFSSFLSFPNVLYVFVSFN